MLTLKNIEDIIQIEKSKGGIDMAQKTSDDYISNRAWLRDMVGGKRMILRGVSALEYLQLFVGYVSESTIEVYSEKLISASGFKCCVVPSFQEIDYVCEGNVLCCTINQTVNDMIRDFDNIDEVALVESLSRYYYAHDESFDDLIIKPENMRQFNQIREWAIRYYEAG